MYQVSTQYKDIMNRPFRNRAFISVSLGVVNTDAQGDAGVDTDATPLSLYSDETPIYDFKGEPIYYATCEQDYFKADGTMRYVPEGNFVNLENIGIASQNILGAIKFVFGDEYDLKGLTLNFGEYYPTQFTVASDNYTYTYTNNSSEWNTTDVFGETTTLTITPITMVGGQQRLRIFKIVMGVGLTFNDESVSKTTQTERVSFITSELPQNDFSATILDPDRRFDVDSNESFINYLQTGQQLKYAVGLELDDGSVEWLPMADNLLTDWSVKGQEVTFKSSDRISFMDEIYTAGNTIHSRTLFSDATALLTFAGLSADQYIIDECLKDITVTNPLPEVSVAQCLQMVCNAGRCIMYQNREGKVVIRANFQIVLDPNDVTVTTTGETAYSNPHNVLVGATTVYANCTQDFFSANGTMKYLPTDSNDYDSNTGFISEEVADSDGLFVTNPTLTMDLGGTVNYYGLNINFDGNPPQEIVIRTYSSGVLVNEFTYENLDILNYLSDTYAEFDTMTIEFTKAWPNNRIVVNKIAFGDASDYKLTFDNIYGNLTGVREKKVKDVRVKVYTFQNDSDGNPEEVKDSVFETETLGAVGQTITLTNPLISTSTLAQQVAEWLGNYYANNVTYSCEYRGEPRLNATDIIFLDSDVLNNLQAEIETHTFNYNGAFRGNVELRRALRLV